VRRAAGNGVSGCRDEGLKSTGETVITRRDRKSQIDNAGIARKRGLFAGGDGLRGLRRLGGGVRSLVRTGLH
jgi:hypothetical protein